jgi:glutamine synthetase adenylyltransferase
LRAGFALRLHRFEPRCEGQDYKIRFGTSGKSAGRPDGKNGATSIGKKSFLNYLKTRADIWEWLAYVKLRGVAGEIESLPEIEFAARRTVHDNALQTDSEQLKAETMRVRGRLAQEKSKGKGTDIKFDEGGLLDVYFAMRFLQLRDNIPDDAENRSTQFMLKKLYESSSLTAENFAAFSEGHYFLTLLDHNLRLTIGRSNSLPLANRAILETVARRMKLDSIEDLSQKLTVHRLEIRAAFEKVFE